ncbi:uncharacterized protein LOC123448350 [Hordeum vulgare subsp. vulgare]|uniref:Predicted protein n=1 Tax=Hordeum vulgare subsp. vulgare TaxID=112509 RepID=F2ECK8_HORVV|nr:uncharacterized protein LOC123448350 [Hordeum vulgare subsp. vulgare]BAK05080.1 predicted protein [Hordeum vulgare subsp. vulgare]
MPAAVVANGRFHIPEEGFADETTGAGAPAATQSPGICASPWTYLRITHGQEVEPARAMSPTRPFFLLRCGPSPILPLSPLFSLSLSQSPCQGSHGALIVSPLLVPRLVPLELQGTRFAPYLVDSSIPYLEHVQLTSSASPRWRCLTLSLASLAVAFVFCV